jgi:outer membrane receptor protein involved in Fe transport
MGAVPNPGYVEVNCGNPLMTAQENQLLCGSITTPVSAAGTPGAGPDQQVTVIGPNGKPFTYWNGAANSTPGQSLLYVGRRGVEVGGRVTDTTRDAFRIVVGAKGDLGDGWSYDVFAQYGRTVFQEELSNDWAKSRVQNALEVDPTTGACINSPPGCQPLDIFNGIGSLNSPSGRAGLDYITITDLQEGYTEEQVMGGNLTGDLGQWGGQLPWAKNPIAVVFGTEYRQETLKFQVDTTNSGGDTYGGATTLPTPQSAFSVTEGYTEVRIPLVQDMHWVEDLTAHGAYRYSSYSSVGAVHSYAYDLTYQPIDDLRFRAAYQRATRAPNVLESFKPQNTILFSGTDPCSTSTTGQCANVPNAGNPNGILSCPAGQCNELTGGNPHLKPEVSDTRTIGVVFTPTFIDGFNATIDYYAINVSDYIGTYGAQAVLNGCYAPSATAASEALFCPLVHRGGTGGVYGSPSAYVGNPSVNLPYIKTKGIDFEANYTTSFDDWGWSTLMGLGGLSTNFRGTWLKQWTESPESVTVPDYFNCAGKFGVICGSTNGTGGVLPRWRHTLRVTWTSPWDVDVSLNWRHISSVDLDLNATNPLLNGGSVPDYADHQIRAYNYFDLAAVWTVREGVELRAGVNNIFADNPPALSSSSPNVTPQPFGSANTYPGVYDILGREIFVGATIKY